MGERGRVLDTKKAARLERPFLRSCFELEGDDVGGRFGRQSSVPFFFVLFFPES